MQQQEFCREVQGKFKSFFKNKFVLDIGSLDINGNNQEWFEDCKYLGVDIAYGRNVDIVSKGHELGFPDNTFDIIISTECFEHDQYYDATIKNIFRMLKPGGMFIFTCATTGRPEHGTRRTTPEDAPFLQDDIEWSDYYKNLTEADIRDVLDIDSSFINYQFSTNNESHDLYFYGFKSGEYKLHNGYSFLHSASAKQLPINYSQLFIDIGNGVSEENSIKLLVAQHTETQEFIFDLSNLAGLHSLRFDPLNDSCVIKIEKLAIMSAHGEIDLTPYISTNACSVHDLNYFFELYDPQIYFKDLSNEQLAGAEQFVANIRYVHTDKAALHACAQQITQDKVESERCLHDEIARIKNSKSWRITAPFRVFSIFFDK